MSVKKLAFVGAQIYCEMRKKLVLPWRRLACRTGFTDGAQVPAGLSLAPTLALMNRTPN